MTTIQGILVCLASLFYWTSGVEGAEATTRRTEDITGNSGQQCCNQKSVGDYEYKLINMENTSAHQCKDGCVYTRYGEQSSRYCFKVGNQPASCLSLEKSCQNEALSIGTNGHCTEECQIDTESTCKACLSEKMSSECFHAVTALCFPVCIHLPCFTVIADKVWDCEQHNPFKWAECAMRYIPSRCKTPGICGLIGNVNTAAGIGCKCVNLIPHKVWECRQDDKVKWAACALDKIPSNCKSSPSEICGLIGDVNTEAGNGCTCVLTTIPQNFLECRQDDKVKWAECALARIPSNCKPSLPEICGLIGKLYTVAGNGCTCVITAPGVITKCYDKNKPSVPYTFECIVADLPQDCISSACYLLGKALPELGPELPIFCDCIGDAVQALAKCDEEHPGEWEKIAKCTLEKGAVDCINAVCKYAERQFPEIKKTPVCGCLAATLQDVLQCHDDGSNGGDWNKIIECALKSAASNCKQDVCTYAGKKYPAILATPVCKKK